MSNTSALNRRVWVPALISATLAATCLGGGIAPAPASAAQNAEACGGAPSRTLGIDEIITQRKTQMAADYAALALARTEANHGRN